MYIFFLLFSLAVQWDLFTRFGEMVAIFLMPSVCAEGHDDGKESSSRDSKVCQWVVKDSTSVFYAHFEFQPKKSPTLDFGFFFLF